MMRRWNLACCIVRAAFICLLFLLSFSSQAQIWSISAARSQKEGTLVTVRGIATSGAELGRIRFLQDATGGIGAYPGTGSAPGFEAAVKPGDSIEVSGKLTNFHDMLQISPVMAYKVISSGHSLPRSQEVALSQLSETYEGQLITIACASFEAGGTTFQKASTYSISDGAGGAGVVYLRAGHTLLNTSIPAGSLRLTGVLNQYDEKYQLQPRSSADLALSPCFYLEQQPQPTDIQATSLQIGWRTNIACQATLLYGPTAYLGQSASLSATGPAFTHTLTGLQPGTVYWAEVECEQAGQKIRSPRLPFITRSTSMGQVKVLFNYPIDESVAGPLKPEAQSYDAMLKEILARINAAQKTIDVAMYNVNRNDLVGALLAAHQRGVRVRYVSSASEENSALQGQIPFGLIAGNGRSLMHNKFMVIDADLPDRCWVMAGSTNWTSGGLVKDCNNVVFVQDQSLARAYTLEFEEMYGSHTASPDPARATFGAAKRNNTPHHFLIGGKNVECYFSPSDRVTQRIIEVAQTAQSEAQFGVFFFTEPQPAQALVQASKGGAHIRGILDDIGTGSEFNYLKGNGVEVRHHAAPDFFHHKYLVVDAAQEQSDPMLLTGSHNWTFTANTENDENILIFHDASLATLYKAEFTARWEEISVSGTADIIPEDTRLVPNPAENEVLVIGPTSAQITLLDVNGKEWAFELAHNSGTTRLRLQGIPSGQYFIRVKRKDAPSTTLPFQKI